MSIEIELLERCKDIINNGCGEWERVCISNEIEEELAKPEKKPLTDDEIGDTIMNKQDANCYEYVNGYIDGIKFTEKHHGITK
jgi:hypothetical protein